MRRNTSTLLGSRAAIGLALTACGVLVGAAQADTIEPTFDTFGELPDATFSGTGIPNEHVAITTIQDGNNTITLGLSATQRYWNPDVTNDGAGTFTAQAGANYGDPNDPMNQGNPSGLLGSTWNFNFYIDIEGGGTFDDYQFELLYDFDPGEGTQKDDHGVWDINTNLTDAHGQDLADWTKFETSQNLDFNFLSDTGEPAGISAPTVGQFDPYALGEYSFGLYAYDGDGNSLGETAMVVQVIPLPAPVFMGLAGLAGVAVLRRRAVSQSA